jgi:hypothetical protein
MGPWLQLWRARPEGGNSPAKRGEPYQVIDRDAGRHPPARELPGCRSIPARRVLSATDGFQRPRGVGANCLMAPNAMHETGPRGFALVAG